MRITRGVGVTQLSRNGITPALLKPGTEVRIEGSRSRTDAQPSDLKLEPFNCSPEGVNDTIKK